MSSTRPLGRLSDFVVEELPQLLVEDQGLISSRVEGLLKELIDNNELHKAYFQDRELSLLDLKLVEVALIRKGIKVPKILTNAVDFFCTNLNVPGLQYHELVRVNPIDDMRAFMTGEERETEILFYNSHRWMEERFARLIDAVESFLAKESDTRPLLNNFNELMDFGPIRNFMVGLAKMKDGHFGVFRPFISTPCPVRQVDGPSGAYSWRIPYLTLLMFGIKVPESYIADMRSKEVYFSAIGRGKITRRLAVLSTEKSLLDKIPDCDRLVPVLHTWIAFMQSFRRMHYKAVEKQVPEAIKDETAGTSGNPTPGKYLRDTMNAMDNLYEWFIEEHPLSEQKQSSG